MSKSVIKFYVDDGICRASADPELDGLAAVLRDHYMPCDPKELIEDIKIVVKKGVEWETSYNSSFLKYDGLGNIKMLDCYTDSPYCVVSFITLQEVCSHWADWINKCHAKQENNVVYIEPTQFENTPRDMFFDE